MMEALDDYHLWTGREPVDQRVAVVDRLSGRADHGAGQSRAIPQAVEPDADWVAPAAGGHVRYHSDSELDASDDERVGHEHAVLWPSPCDGVHCLERGEAQ